MTKGLALFLLACCLPADATTYTVNPAQSISTIQRIITRAFAGDTISFAAGTYTITGGLSLKCGVTYTGPVATPATAILSSTFSQLGSIFSLNPGSGYANPCTQPTTIEYLNFQNSGGIYVKTSFTNLKIQYNQFTNLPCCNGGPSNAGIYFDGGQSTSNTAQRLTDTLIQWNTFGDINSCTSPTNSMTNTNSPENNQGNCNGIIADTTIDGLTVEHNNFFHIGEGVHLTCPTASTAGQKYPCEPPNGAITNNITVEYNDFNQIHRIPWEEQPQQSSGIVFQYNSIHDWFMAYYGSFGVSFACCYNGTHPPNLIGSNNVIIFNAVPVDASSGGRYGYGMEAMGLSAIYDHELVQSGNFGTSIGMSWGRGPVGSMSYNTVCGGGFASARHIADEGFGAGAPKRDGNVTESTCSAVHSVAPTISPSSGTQSFPLTVTLTDPGYTSGPQPLGNTGIWYTTDGSAPVPGSGTARYLSSSGTFVLPAAATVKAVGMWGAANQPSSYPVGYGFVPSAVQSAHYTSGAEGQQRRPR
jgi:hypothetical protein